MTKKNGRPYYSRDFIAFRSLNNQIMQSLDIVWLRGMEMVVKLRGIVGVEGGHLGILGLGGCWGGGGDCKAGDQVAESRPLHNCCPPTPLHCSHQVSSKLTCCDHEHPENTSDLNLFEFVLIIHLIRKSPLKFRRILLFPCECQCLRGYDWFSKWEMLRFDKWPMWWANSFKSFSLTIYQFLVRFLKWLFLQKLILWISYFHQFVEKKLKSRIQEVNFYSRPDPLMQQYIGTVTRYWIYTFYYNIEIIIVKMFLHQSLRKVCFHQNHHTYENLVDMNTDNLAEKARLWAKKQSGKEKTSFLQETQRTH